MKIVQLGGMILPLVFCAAMQANASVVIPMAVIDFESLAQDNADVNSHGAIYSEDGYRLENLATAENSGFDPSFSSYGTLAGDFSVSTSLMNDNYLGITRLSAINGSLFSMYSIDVSEISQASAYTDTITFHGITFDGSDVYQSFGIDGVFGNETLYFDITFGDLVQVEWENPSNFVQFDNITASPVPVPSSILLFGTVLTALAAAGKRRKQS